MFSLARLLPLLAVMSCRSAPGPDRPPLAPVPFDRVTVDDPFWSPRLEAALVGTIPHCLDECEASGRVANFDVAAGVGGGSFRGRLYDDSDLYKVIEGAACALALRRDAGLEARVEGIVARIAAAQEDDGYLATYWQTEGRGRRFTDLRGGHELYCAGHLIEAALAWRRATGREDLLAVARRLADCIDRELGPGGRFVPPGHQELELALLALADACAEPRYEALARRLLAARGHHEDRASWGEYCQDHLPVREQRAAVGHAVRAMYQACALADLARRDGDRELRATLEALWDDVQAGKVYVTGGIGSVPGIEGFGPAFVLPNDTAYTETCAAIAKALFDWRMYLLTADPRYGDALERVLYNGVASGVSRDGRRFFYDNPLGSRGQHERRPWFACACCPSNVARFVPAVGGKVWATGGPHCCGSAARTEVEVAGTGVGLALAAGLPWSGEAALLLSSPAAPVAFTLVLREPAWCRGRLVPRLAGSRSPARARGACASTAPGGRGTGSGRHCPRRPPRRRPRVVANEGACRCSGDRSCACLEGVDHGGHCATRAAARGPLEAVARPDLLGGIVALRQDRPHAGRGGSDHRGAADAAAAPPGPMLPGGTCASRGELVTWIPTDTARAEPPGLGPSARVGDRELWASHCWHEDSVAACMDGRLPRSSRDPQRSAPDVLADPGRRRARRLPRPAGQARGRERVLVRRRRSGRLPDCGSLHGGCCTRRRVLAAGAPRARLRHGRSKVAAQAVRFAPVEAREWMLEVTLRDDWSAGVLGGLG
ncbi:MAG: glycoside hydrolase family 127 protein [Planctomycetota bacterium]